MVARDVSIGLLLCACSALAWRLRKIQQKLNEADKRIEADALEKRDEAVAPPVTLQSEVVTPALQSEVVTLQSEVVTPAPVRIESAPFVQQQYSASTCEPFVQREHSLRVPLRISSASKQWMLADVDAYLIDLDGTIYNPNGPIEGAAAFYAAVLRHKPHVFLSNTGAKGADGVRSKLAKNGIIMGPKSQDLHIWTAAQAQCRFLVDTIPAGARVFIIAGGNADGPSSYWMRLLRMQAASLVSTWAIRTNLTDAMAREWAAAAAAGRSVFVVLFSDGSISSVTDPHTGEAGFDDWTYDVIKKTSFLLSHGAELVATAEDAFNPSQDSMPLPGPGMFCAMFRKLLHPLGVDRLHVCGKGGNEGSHYMMGHALEMLRRQGFRGDASRVLIVGDRFDTDILAGALAGVRTCLVESGCHSASLQPHFAEAPADFVAASIAELLPPAHRGPAARLKRISFDYCSRTVAPLPEPPGADSAGCAPPQFARTPSDGSSRTLRAWALGHGNLVYSARSGAVHGPLIHVLRTFFTERARGTASTRSAALPPSSASSGERRGSLDALPTISAADALEAMRALGISPPTQLAAGRPLHRFPFEVSDGSRVTFAKLCREVQRALEMGGGTGRYKSVFDGGAIAGRSSPTRQMLSTENSNGTGVRGAASLGEMSAFTPAASRAGKMPPVCSVPAALDQLGATWQQEQRTPRQEDRIVGSPATGPPVQASRLVRALVDPRFLYLGTLRNLQAR